MELEQGKNVDFWRDMTIITEDEIAKLRKLEASGKGGPGELEGRGRGGCQGEGKQWVKQRTGAAACAQSGSLGSAGWGLWVWPSRCCWESPEGLGEHSGTDRLPLPVCSGERRDGVNASVSSDVQSVFKGKTYNQLQVLYQGIESKIRAGGPNLDVGYWESLLQQLKAYMARAR